MQYFLVEISYEAGNKVGGIWTVLTSKSRVMKAKFGDNYLAIGFYNPSQAAIEMIEEEPSGYILNAIKDMQLPGIKFHYGSWAQGNNVKLLLLDTSEFKQNNVNQIKGMFWDKFKIDSLNAPEDYNEPLAWSYAVGAFVESLAKFINMKIVCQVHEWLSAGAILYLKMKNSRIPTVFTIHATVLGRAISYGGNDIQALLKQKSIDDKVAYDYGVQAKHLTEKAGAFNATVFTAVSETVADEAQVMLGKRPDVITINGIDITGLPSMDDLEAMRKTAQDKLYNFLNAYFLPYYDTEWIMSPLIFTSGRYEFYDKGFDLFIDALGRLDKMLPDGKYVIALIAVPTGTLSTKNEVAANYLTYLSVKAQLSRDIKGFEETASMLPTANYSSLDKAYNRIITDARLVISELRRPRPTNPPICPFVLSYPEENDQILSALKRNGLVNSKDNKVKVIFYPKYLMIGDELLNLTYNELLSISTAGVFLSKYEPFGYTPLEAAAYGSLSFTTDRSGFGKYLQTYKFTNQGIFIESLGDERDNVVKKVAYDILQIVSLEQDDIFALRTSARKTAELFDWEGLITNYLQAYELALSRP